MSTQLEPSSREPGQGPVETAPLHHVGINVAPDDFQKMIDWYQNVLDLTINYRGIWEETQICFLVNDDANHRVVFTSNPVLQSRPEGPYAGLNHTAYEFPSIDGLLAKYAQLRDEEIFPYMAIDHGITFSIYYMDPNGYGIELQVDAYGDWTKSSEIMHTASFFKENPVGILFDPDALIGAREEGLSSEEIHQGTYFDGAYPPTAEQRRRLAVMGVPLRNAWDHPSWPDDHATFVGID